MGASKPVCPYWGRYWARCEVSWDCWLRPFLDDNGGDPGFAIIRKSDNVAIFDTRGLPLTYADQYLEIGTNLPKGTFVYGMGEVTGPFLRETGHRYAFWSRGMCQTRVLHLYCLTLSNAKCWPILLLIQMLKLQCMKTLTPACQCSLESITENPLVS